MPCDYFALVGILLLSHPVLPHLTTLTTQGIVGNKKIRESYQMASNTATKFLISQDQQFQLLLIKKIIFVTCVYQDYFMISNP